MHPSLTESLCKAWLDAMAHGLPVIAADVGAARAAIGEPGERGLLVPAGDPSALADAIARLLNEPRDWPALRRGVMPSCNPARSKPGPIVSASSVPRNGDCHSSTESSNAAVTHDAAVWGGRLTLLVAAGWVAAEWVGFLAALRALTFLGFAAAIAGVRRPALGLLGIGILAVLDPVSRHLVMGSGGLLRWNSFNYWLVLFTLVWLPRVWRLSDPHSRLLRALILVLAIGLPFASRWEPGLQTLLNVATVFALVVYAQRAPRDAESMFWLGIVMSVTAAVGGFGTTGMRTRCR